MHGHLSHCATLTDAVRWMQSKEVTKSSYKPRRNEKMFELAVYKRLHHRVSMLEAPRIAAMQQLAEQARQRTTSESDTRSIENVRRAEMRDNFTAATKDWVSIVSAEGKTMLGMRRARGAAVGELCAAVDLTMSQVKRVLLRWFVYRQPWMVDLLHLFGPVNAAGLFAGACCKWGVQICGIYVRNGEGGHWEQR